MLYTVLLLLFSNIFVSYIFEGLVVVLKFFNLISNFLFVFCVKLKVVLHVNYTSIISCIYHTTLNYPLRWGWVGLGLIMARKAGVLERGIIEERGSIVSIV